MGLIVIGVIVWLPELVVKDSSWTYCGSWVDFLFVVVVAQLCLTLL